MNDDYTGVHNHKTEGLNQALRDYEVCKAVLNGNTQAFAILAAQYQKRVYMLGLSFFDNTDDCEDFVQDVMLKAYSALGTFRAEAPFATWLMRIAYNTALNSVKKRNRYSSLADGTEIEYRGDNPEEKHLNECIVLSVREAVNSLPDNYRICIDLYFFYDMSYTDIAAVTELPLNTIKSHIFRAKKILREYLKEDRTVFEYTHRRPSLSYPAVVQQHH
ncbi:sigma-70 family RNA polymerase sigma factor [Treponema vincentii]|jgi:RNA polymerase sigma factor, sigma-70 family|uniref:Sigma-70 family RNA polymerase sigma factor n=2 Tax=Treponema vincentii TaxID=69710 RepID=S3L9A2_9SPIR|nr:sigma-70 family RNA polymerase sigma factor [Treponema vincentii]EPF47028.1 sigma-70 family RNA polymerase sigma factor [Treponema vincentii F0403]UTC46673.1 sigma-70 family RNA polymerase sigma factor [Treponema vincentii]UTC59520.1 sigma-70 family RNA polymerase sigma factor [Treponema vincentii]